MFGMSLWLIVASFQALFLCAIFHAPVYTPWELIELAINDIYRKDVKYKKEGLNWDVLEESLVEKGIIRGED